MMVKDLIEQKFPEKEAALKERLSEIEAKVKQLKADFGKPV